MAKKRHHTVSEFLLGRFAHDDGKVCQLDIGTGANKRISPNDATVVKHFYSIDIDDGKRSPEVEDALGKIESVAAPGSRRSQPATFCRRGGKGWSSLTSSR